jgi:hypothetical protein
LLALGILQARRQGGGWRIAVSLARTAAWLDDLGREEDESAALAVGEPDPAPYLRTIDSPWGPVTHVPPCTGDYPSPPERPGTSPARWPR